MNTKRIILAVTLCLAPRLAPAQSFWLHIDSIGGTGGQLQALDSDDCLYVPGTPHSEVVTGDYWNSWKYVFTDTAANMNHATFTGVAHPSKHLVLIGWNDSQVGQILRSTDGGRSWKDSTIGSYVKGGPFHTVEGVAALDSNHLFVLINGDSSLISTNGGATWKWIPCPGFSYFGGIYDLLRPIVFLDTSTILIEAVVNSLNLYSTSTISTIYRTTDLGATWDSSYQPSFLITKFAAVSKQVAFASGTDYNFWKPGAPPIQTDMIIKTTNAGATWSTALDTQIVAFSSYFGGTAGLYGIAFADSLHAFACGDDGLILQTRDGGNTWNEMHSDYTKDAEEVDFLGDVAYPDTNHAVIASSEGSLLIYHPNGILSLPNITYPLFTTLAMPHTFDLTWDPVPSATRYSLMITTSGYPDSNTAIVVKDMNVMSTFYHLSDLVDTSPGQAGRQYEIFLQAFNATNQSNRAERAFIVYQSSNGVVLANGNSEPALELYPNPATNWLSVKGFSGSVTICDALGRVQRCLLHDGKFDISHLPAGIYYIMDGLHRAKFVKQ